MVKLNQAIIDGFFSHEEVLVEKNKLIEQKHILRRELEGVEYKSEEALWALTGEVINLFNYLLFGYRQLNPIIKRKLLNFLFLNRRLEDSKLVIETIPAFEKLRPANNLLQGQKLLLTQNHMVI